MLGDAISSNDPLSMLMAKLTPSTHIPHPLEDELEVLSITSPTDELLEDELE